MSNAGDLYELEGMVERDAKDYSNIANRHALSPQAKLFARRASGALARVLRDIRAEGSRG